MKIKGSFVTNSSSTSFVISRDPNGPKKIKLRLEVEVDIDSYRHYTFNNIDDIKNVYGHDIKGEFFDKIIDEINKGNEVRVYNIRDDYSYDSIGGQLLYNSGFKYIVDDGFYFKQLSDTY